MINWKLRFKNKTVLVALIGAVVAFVYQILEIFNVVPKVSEDAMIQFFGILLNLLAGVGVLVDPTTAGISDSVTAMTYDKPRE